MNSTNTTTPPYYISNVVASGCGSVLVPGDILYVNWDIYGDASYDTCYLGIRPISDLMTDDAVVAEAAPHPQCFGTSANIVIPKVPKNAAFPFNGSHFVARINTPDKLHADSCTFKIRTAYQEPFSRADKMSLAGVIIAGISVLAALLLGIATYRQSNRIDRLKSMQEQMERQAAGDRAEAEAASKQTQVGSVIRVNQPQGSRHT
ncbi:hypothetical protein LTR02_018049 [Friedmanniomyces endolithicus]|nr:hypothetical protein LTR02_018049 [Friedmanniomyces endolithicus]